MEEKKKVKRRRLTNEQKEKAKEIEDRRALIRACLKRGDCTTKVEISNATGIKLSLLNSDLLSDRELFAEYKLVARTIAEIASDNISAIIKDKTHPKNYSASMKMIENYESEFNEILESNDGAGIDVEMTGDNGDPIGISFSVSKKK